MVSVLLVIVRETLTRVPFPATFVEGGGRTEDIVESKFDIAGAWRAVVMVEVIVGTHCLRCRATQVRPRDRNQSSDDMRPVLTFWLQSSVASNRFYQHSVSPGLGEGLWL